jgi:hypothetical protein
LEVCWLSAREQQREKKHRSNRSLIVNSRPGASYAPLCSLGLGNAKTKLLIGIWFGTIWRF